MSLNGHYQNAYITHDIDAAIRLWGERLGIRDWIRFEPVMVLKTPEGDRDATVRAALGWVGGLQLELIEPVSGHIAPYATVLPEDTADSVPRFHHIAVRRDDEAEMRAEAQALGFPLAFEGSVPGLTFIYLDAREALGHFLELVCATPQMWSATGWPAGRPT